MDPGKKGENRKLFPQLPRTPTEGFSLNSNHFLKMKPENGIAFVTFPHPLRPQIRVEDVFFEFHIAKIGISGQFVSESLGSWIVQFFPSRLLLGGRFIQFLSTCCMEKAIVKACAVILVGVSILIIALWGLANYIWEE
jgi:hypothetical protein